MIPGIGIYGIKPGGTAAADGKYMVAVADNDYIWISSDFGLNWTSRGSTGAWKSCSISGDGKYILASNATITYLSRDSGATFNAIGTCRSSTYGLSASMSADGKYIYARSSYYIKKSTDYGATFTILSQNLGNHNLLKCSHDGKYVLAYQTSYTAQYFMLSADYGVTFSAVSFIMDTYAALYGLDISKDGKYIIAAVYQGYSAMSGNYGSTWTVGSIYGASSACVNGSGQYMAIQYYYSTDFGVNWASRAIGYGPHVDCSFSGKYFAYHTASAGYLKVSANYGNTYSSVAGSKTWRCISIGKIIS